MQPRSRRGDRPLLPREHCLIVSAVLFVGRAAAGDVGRQRHVAAFGKRLVEDRPVKRKGERDLAALSFRLHRGVELVEEAHPALAAEAHDIADGEALPRLHQRVPARAVEPPGQCRRNRRLVRAAADAAAVQARRNDFRVVHHHGVAFAQQRWQVTHDAVLERRRCARPHHEEPGAVARNRRTQRYAILGKRKIKKVGAHI